MKRGITMVGAAGVGAALTYLLDPNRGHDRRARLRSKTGRYLHDLSHFFDVALRDIGNRSLGVLGEARYHMRGKPASDELLLCRVAAKLGHHVTYPRVIDISVEKGSATLAGPILRTEKARALKAIASVPGVKLVCDELKEYDRREDFPNQQGSEARIDMRAFAHNEAWRPATRLAGGLAGLALVVDGTRRGSKVLGLSEVGIGTVLGLRSVANRPMPRLLGLTGSRRGVDFQKTVNIKAQIEEVYSFFNDVASFPCFMHNVLSVTEMDDGRSHWIVRGPLGLPISWEAEISRLEPNKTISWRSVEGTPVPQGGIIKFEDLKDEGTRVQIRMSYNPPGGVIGHVFATLCGANPKRELDEDLARVKSYFETGKPARDAAQKASCAIVDEEPVPLKRSAQVG